MLLSELVSTHRIAECTGEWVAAAVRPQHASAAQKRIEAQGVPTFNPSEQIKLTNLHGRETGFRPIFPGYIFACIPNEMRLYVVREAFGVWSCIRTKDQARFVRELDQVQQMLDADPMLMQSRPVRPGFRARVICGAFEGFEGMIDKLDGDGNFVILLTLFGREVPTNISAADVEPC